MRSLKKAHQAAMLLMLALLGHQTSYGDELELGAKAVESGIRLLNQKVQDAHTLHGTCKIVTQNEDRFPRRCSMVKFSLQPVGQSKENSKLIQSSVNGEFSVKDLKPEEYQLHVVSPHYHFIEGQQILIRGGQDIMITLIQDSQK